MVLSEVVSAFSASSQWDLMLVVNCPPGTGDDHEYLVAKVNQYIPEIETRIKWHLLGRDTFDSHCLVLVSSNAPKHSLSLIHHMLDCLLASNSDNSSLPYTWSLFSHVDINNAIFAGSATTN